MSKIKEWCQMLVDSEIVSQLPANIDCAIYEQYAKYLEAENAELRAKLDKSGELPYGHLVTLRLLTSAAICYAITKNRITERMASSKDIADLFMHIPLLQGTTLNFALDYLAESKLNCDTIQGFEDIINAMGTFKEYVTEIEARLTKMKGGS